jgi:hypothetical protein
MGTSRRWTRLVTRAAAISASLVIGGCGTTAPSGPSPVPTPAPQYHSLVGDWMEYPSLVGDWLEAGSRVVLEFRDRHGVPTQGQSFGCDTEMQIREQTGGTFSGTAVVQGGSGQSGQHCTAFLSFSGQMAADGTITSFRLDRPFGGGCTVVSEQSFSGTATSTAIGITMTDRGTCWDFIRQLRDTDRTLTMWVMRRPDSAP